MITFDIELLDNFLKNFYTALDIRISIFDNQYNLVTEYPKEAPEYCTLIRSTEAGKKGCRDCDIYAFKTATELRKQHVYVCHAGLTEAVMPIILNGETAGYIILAHMLPTKNYTDCLNRALLRAKKYGISEEEALPKLEKIKKYSTEKINASVQILTAITIYLRNTEIVSWKQDTTSKMIANYIDNNLDQEINCDDICKSFFISRTTLFNIFKKNFGVSISNYIVSKRIEKSKELLKTDMPICKIAEKVGIADSSYFGKIFCKHVGMSPSKYRSNLKSN